MRSFLLLLTVCAVTTLSAQIRVLHYDETTGFDHNTRTQSLAYFTALGNTLGFTVTRDGNGSEFTTANLANFDLVIFSNTSGNSGLTQPQRDALENFVDVQGGSLLGIHAASDTYRHSSANGNRTGTWDWYAETLGGSVQQSPNHTRNNFPGTIVEIQDHPASENITFPWDKLEEYYYWENGYLNEDPSSGINVILEVESTGSETFDAQRPVAWFRQQASGARIFYTSLGHRADNFTGAFPDFENLLADATAWVLEAALPVTLTAFTATPRFGGKQVRLNWTTASESGAGHFTVERSRDGILYGEIATLAANGNTSTPTDYETFDLNPTTSRVYYRLRQTDLDGRVQLSAPVVVMLAETVRVSPNPGTTELTISAAAGTTYEVRDGAGRSVATGRLATDTQVIPTATWPKGVYLVQTHDGDGAAPVLRWAKQ